MTHLTGSRIQVSAAVVMLLTLLVAFDSRATATTAAEFHESVRVGPTNTFIPVTGEGALRLRWASGGRFEVRASSDPNDPQRALSDHLFNEVSEPMILTVPVRGPARSRTARTVRLRVSDLGCASDCHTVRAGRAVPRLDSRGHASVRFRLGIWGCGQPRIVARLELRSGATTTPVRWSPQTICGE